MLRLTQQNSFAFLVRAFELAPSCPISSQYCRIVAWFEVWLPRKTKYILKANKNSESPELSCSSTFCLFVLSLWLIVLISRFILPFRGDLFLGIRRVIFAAFAKFLKAFAFEYGGVFRSDYLWDSMSGYIVFRKFNTSFCCRFS